MTVNITVLEFIKSIVRPFILAFWVVMRVVVASQGVEMVGLGILTVGMDAATLEYVAERAYKRLKETGVDYDKLARAVVKYQEEKAKAG